MVKLCEGGEREHASEHTGERRAAPEVALVSVVTATGRLADQEDRGHIAADGDEQRSGQQRCRARPRRERRVLAAEGDLAGRNAADHGAHEERRQQRGEREDGAEQAFPVKTLYLLPEGKAGAP